MAGFSFELEHLLEQRRREEGERQREVAELERERVRIEGEIQAAQRSLRSAREDLSSALRGAESASGRRLVDTQTIRRQSTASLRSAVGLQEAGLRLSGTHQRLDQARGRLAKATAARKAVELLKDRRYREWRRRQRRREEAELEDVARAQSRIVSEPPA